MKNNMKIKLDDKHYLICDPFCYWITCEYEVQEGKGKGNIVERRVSGYTSTFEQCVNSFIERGIKAAEIVDFSGLVKVINDLKEEVRVGRLIYKERDSKWTRKAQG